MSPGQLQGKTTIDRGQTLPRSVVVPMLKRIIR